MLRNNLGLLLFLLFNIMPLTIAAQEEMSNVPEMLFTRRLVWSEAENVWRYAVEIDKQENGTYHSHYRDFTRSLYVIVSLPAGEYRFRIVTHDILDRPYEGTQWVHFTVRPPIQGTIDPAALSTVEIESKQFHDIDSSDYSDSEEQIAESVERKDSARFNTVGGSLGTAFTDPFVIITLHGTYAPINNFFIELGCDAGFISEHEDADNFYSIYPYANLCYYLPFRNKIGIFAGAGAGYILGAYHFSHGGIAEFNIFSVNLTAGVNLIDVINISYTFRTDFAAVNHQIAVGYVYRFKHE